MFGTLTFLLLLLNSVCDGYQYKNVARHPKYDYIIVGGGSAGSPLASELSKDGKYTVLLLEAGGPPPPRTEIPIYVEILGETGIDWNGYSEPQENACLNDPQRRCALNTAQTLGGGSSHNHMAFVRGNKLDFDTWEAMGAKGWNYNNVLEVFKKIEDFNIPEYSNNGYHGKGGLITISPIKYHTKLGQAYLDAGKSMGYNSIDYNGPSQQGISRFQVNQRDGLRCGSEKAFLRPAINRENLDILVHAFVHKVTFDDRNNVKSVIFDHENQTKEIEVNREVILSAGTLSSPKILMLSGIGPKEHLKEMKIPVTVDLPGVGQNLQDHLMYKSLNYLLNDSVGIVPGRDINPDTIAELLNKEGPLTSPGLMEVVAFINTSCPNCHGFLPDVSLNFAASCPLLPLNDSSLNSTSIWPILLRPKSHGELKLRSADPYDDPRVDPKYLSHPDDMANMLKGIKMAMSVMETPELQKYNPKLIKEMSAGCEHLDVKSDEFLECAIRHDAGSSLHYTSTCKMGDPTDSQTVVDSELRVKGVKGLRVADASIMPYAIAANPNAACMMIGQKAADIILSNA